MTTQEIIEILQADRIRRKLEQRGISEPGKRETPAPTLYSLLLSWLLLDR
jgi:hypothetical protein